QLLVKVYASLDGFPSPVEAPSYYSFLENIGMLTDKPGVQLLVATTKSDDICGAVVYFDDMTYYGSGGTAPSEKLAAGFRLLAVCEDSRGMGIGKLLTQTCIQRAKEKGHSELIIHSTESMRTAWTMYVNMGFRRSEDLDFDQNGLQVFGFRLPL